MLGSPPYSGLSAGDPCAGRDLSPGLRRLVPGVTEIQPGSILKPWNVPSGWVSSSLKISLLETFRLVGICRERRGWSAG